MTDFYQIPRIICYRKANRLNNKTLDHIMVIIFLQFHLYYYIVEKEYRKILCLYNNDNLHNNNTQLKNLNMMNFIVVKTTLEFCLQ